MRCSPMIVRAATLTVALLSLLGSVLVRAEQAGGPSHGRGPVYQRHAYGPAMDSAWRGGHNDHGKESPAAVAHVNSGWFQRPYPYHLDYYRMRYGGSYAPYFGNLYGPPQVVTAPPYYGPYYGGYGYEFPVGYGPDAAFGPRPDCCPCEPAESGEQPSGRAVERQSRGSGVAE
jgi:hypothetical protein